MSTQLDFSEPVREPVAVDFQLDAESTIGDRVT